MSPWEASEDERTGLRDSPADVLAWVALELAEAPDLTPRVFDVHLMIDDVLERFSGPARDKGVALQMKTAATVPARAIGEATWLREVMLGLLDNALKFTDRGEVVASVTSDRTAGGRILFHVEISDTGVGMSAETLARLFGRGAPAAALEGARRRSLPVTRRLIELMDGRIGGSSAVGMGTTIWFTVPLDLPPREASPSGD